MRHFPTLSFIHLLCLLALTISLHSTTTFALPTTTHDLSPSNHAPPPLHLPALLPLKPHPPTHQKRTITTYYNNLGAWRMILTASSTLLYTLSPPTVPAPTLATFLSAVATLASTNAAANTPSQTAMVFGKGAVSLALTVRNGLGGPQTIPWGLVARLAGEFAGRAARGNAAAFRGEVYGPLGKNVMGEEPWIEVVLVVGKEVLFDRIDWSLF